jgi:hypothetical protein
VNTSWMWTSCLVSGCRLEQSNKAHLAQIAVLGQNWRCRACEPVTVPEFPQPGAQNSHREHVFDVCKLFGGRDVSWYSSCVEKGQNDGFARFSSRKRAGKSGNANGSVFLWSTTLPLIKLSCPQMLTADIHDPGSNTK